MLRLVQARTSATHNSRWLNGLRRAVDERTLPVMRFRLDYRPSSLTSFLGRLGTVARGATKCVEFCWSICKLREFKAV